ncbi:MAG: hypothetical protein LBP25_04070 [Tannerellaceae bacterium]|jgi:hypothetical protein|nr:hypothetical protein [Tannerellaceae bacterium]
MIFTCFTVPKEPDAEFVKASSVCEGVLLVMHDLADINTLEHLPEIARTLNRLGYLHKHKYNCPQEANVYEKILQIRRKLVKTSPKAYLPDLVSTLTNLAIFYQEDVPNREKSIQYAKEAVSYRSSLEHLPEVRRYMEQAEEVLRRWNEKKH